MCTRVTQIQLMNVNMVKQLITETSQHIEYMQMHCAMQKFKYLPTAVDV